ncbi:hypothetical protein EGI20_10370 [Aquitalea sp. S1-19]|nr:hypothetical protein [Aquitalea sp. S1-19]
MQRAAVLWPVYLLTDGEAMVAGEPVSLAPLSALETGDAGLIESLLPEIRQLAMVLASRRYQETSPAAVRLSDAADWLAARILLLGLTHIALSESGLGQLAIANQRLAALAQELGLKAPRAEALLLVPSPGTASTLMQGWSGIAFENMMNASSAIERTRVMRVQLRLRAGIWLTRLGL